MTNELVEKMARAIHENCTSNLDGSGAADKCKKGKRSKVRAAGGLTP